jgi:hypothetical protein
MRGAGRCLLRKLPTMGDIDSRRVTAHPKCRRKPAGYGRGRALLPPRGRQSGECLTSFSLSRAGFCCLYLFHPPALSFARTISEMRRPAYHPSGTFSRPIGLSSPLGLQWSPKCSALQLIFIDIIIHRKILLR